VSPSPNVSPAGDATFGCRVVRFGGVVCARATRR
jgi:hypothetical protein